MAKIIQMREPVAVAAISYADLTEEEKLAGESVKDLAEDYGLPWEQIHWGIRLAHTLAELDRVRIQRDLFYE